MQTHSYPRMLAGDTILKRGEQLIIRSRVDMEGWHVQQNRKIAICIDDEVWCLVGKQYAASKEILYRLDPWPERLKEIPGRIIRYDEEYVRTRNEAERKRKLESGVGSALYHVRALLGFLPSRTKARIEASFGVPARSSTLISIIVELLVFFLLGAYLQIYVFGSMRAPQLAASIPFFIVGTPLVFIDMVMRYTSYLREDESPWGFYEWAVSWRAPERRRPS